MGNEFSIPYQINKTSYYYNGVWKVFEGTHSETNEPVSVFVHSLKDRNVDSTEHIRAKWVYKNIRKLRHPNILPFLDGSIDGEKVVIVTERVQELVPSFVREELGNDLGNDYLSYGISQICEAINFLNKRCNMLHLNFSVSSVLTTKNGDWKLFGFDYLAELGKDFPEHTEALIHARFNDSCGDFNSVYKALRSTKSESIELINLAVFVHDCFNSNPLRDLQELKYDSKIPSCLRPDYRKLFDFYFSDPFYFRGRVRNYQSTGKDVEEIIDFNESEQIMKDSGFSVETFLKSPFFDNLLIKRLSGLKEIDLKSLSVKKKFFMSLKDEVSRFPANIATYKVLPKLLSIVFQGFETNENVIEMIFSIAKKATPDFLQKEVCPIIERLFDSTRRKTRFIILNKMSDYIEMISNVTINEKIFPNFSKGFFINEPLLKLITLKNCKIISKRLSSSNFNTKLLMYISQMQHDSNFKVRCAAIETFKEVFEFIIESNRDKIMLKACTIALRDTSPPVRIKSLSCLLETLQKFRVEILASKLIPAISPYLVHQSDNLRCLAIECIEKSFVIIKCNSCVIYENGQKIGKQTNIPKENSSPNQEKVNGIISNAIKYTNKFSSYVKDSMSKSNRRKNTASTSIISTSTKAEKIRKKICTTSNENDFCADHKRIKPAKNKTESAEINIPENPQKFEKTPEKLEIDLKIPDSVQNNYNFDRTENQCSSELSGNAPEIPQLYSDFFQEDLIQKEGFDLDREEILDKDGFFSPKTHKINARKVYNCDEDTANENNFQGLDIFDVSRDFSVQESHNKSTLDGKDSFDFESDFLEEKGSARGSTESNKSKNRKTGRGKKESLKTYGSGDIFDSFI